MLGKQTAGGTHDMKFILLCKHTEGENMQKEDNKLACTDADMKSRYYSINKECHANAD